MKPKVGKSVHEHFAHGLQFAPSSFKKADSAIRACSKVQTFVPNGTRLVKHPGQNHAQLRVRAPDCSTQNGTDPWKLYRRIQMFGPVFRCSHQKYSWINSSSASASSASSLVSAGESTEANSKDTTRRQPLESP